MLLLVCFSHLFAMFLAQGCNPILRTGINDDSAKIQGIQSGSVSLLKGSQNISRIMEYDVVFQQSNGLEYSTAVSVIYIDKYYDKDSLDFAARARDKQGGITIFAIVSKTAIYTSIHIHYISAALEQLRVGTFSAELLSQSPAKIKLESNNYTIESKVIVPKGRFLRVNIFMSGVKTEDRELDLQIQDPRSVKDDGSISFYVITAFQNHQIEHVYFSYIAYLPFEAKSIQLNQIPNEVAAIASLEPGEVQDRHQFLGMTSLSAQNLVNLADTHIRRGRLLVGASREEIGLFQKAFRISAVEVKKAEVLMIPVLKQTSNRRDNKLQAQQVCGVDLCQKQGGIIDASDPQNVRCFICKQNSYLNSSNSECDCDIGFKRDDITQNCIAVCGQNERFLDGACWINAEFISQILDNGCPLYEVFSQIENKCQCIIGFGRDRESNICNALCSFSEVYDEQTKKCVCMQGSHRIGEKCIMCDPNNGRYNEETNECECKQGFSGTGIICRRTLLTGFQGLPSREYKIRLQIKDSSTAGSRN